MMTAIEACWFAAAAGTKGDFRAETRSSRSNFSRRGASIPLFAESPGIRKMRIRKSNNLTGKQMFARCLTIAIALFAHACTTAAIADDDNTKPEFPRAISGRVTDSDGQPLAGALVEWGYFSDGPQDRESVETDAEGRYRLETSNVGRDYRLGVSHSGFAPTFRDGIIPGPAAEPTTLDFQLSPGTDITLRITDRSGNPIPGLDVTPQTPSNGIWSSFSSPVQPTLLPGAPRIVTTDEEGRVLLLDLPAKPTERRKSTLPDGTPNPWNWLCIQLHDGTKSGHRFQIKEAQIIESNSIEHAMSDWAIPGFDERQDGIVRGRVVDRETGEPVTDYQVIVRGSRHPQNVTSDDGRFVSGEARRNGREYQTRIYAGGYAVGLARITAESPDKAVEQTIELERHPSLQGRLLDATTGKPLPDVEILTGAAQADRMNYVEWSDLQRYADGYHALENVLCVTTDEEGRFTVPEEPERPTTLIILTSGYERRVIPPWKRPETIDGVLHVALQPAASVTAIALRETQLGAQANGIAISFESDDGFRHMYHSVPLDESGEIHFDSLAAGEYRLTLFLNLRNFGYPCYSRSFTLEPGEHREVTLGDMPGTIRLHGRAGPLSIVRVWPTFPAEISNFVVQADVDGRFELRDLFPGEYTVSIDNSSAARGYHGSGRSQTIQLREDMELLLAGPPRGPLD